jgi:phage recombination protein Bet
MPETAMTVAKTQSMTVVNQDWERPENLELIKKTVAPGLTDSEFLLFCHVARVRRLDPLQKQIYAMKRRVWNTETNQYEDRMVLQVGIDGFRSIANRTGFYMPSDRLPLVEGEGTKDLRVTVWIKKWHELSAQWMEFGATAYYREFVQTKKDKATGKLGPVSMWEKMAIGQTEKCFSPETEILTERGFQRFDSLHDRVLQVADLGLEPIAVEAFALDYAGPMIEIDNDMLNFSVTPNHDMVTTIGKVEAGAMYASSGMNTSVWQIPMSVTDTSKGVDVQDEDLKLLGCILADGYSSHEQRRFSCSVSKPFKIAILEKLQPESVGVSHSKGTVGVASSGREIMSNFDKKVFSYSALRINRFIDEGKHPTPLLYELNGAQARIVFDAWQKFDGSTNRKTGVRRIYTSREEYCGLIEVMAVKAGYTISQRKTRTSDISDKENFYYTISEVKPITVKKPYGKQRGITKTVQNELGKVWCVRVPSGKIVVRRQGFSMVCGNCAEAKAIRRGWPEELGQFYIPEEVSSSIGVDVLPPENHKQDKTMRDLGTLKVSTEPNRGHGHEGTQRPAEKTICAECRMTDSHAPNCSFSPKARSEHKEDPKQPSGRQEGKKSKREVWEEQPGHDPKIHIPFEDGIALFDLQRKLKLTDDQVKGMLDKEFEVQHRYLIRQDQFQLVLDTIQKQFGVKPQKSGSVPPDDVFA